MSPNGKTLAFVELPAADIASAGRLARVSSSGGDTWYADAGRVPVF